MNFNPIMYGKTYFNPFQRSGGTHKSWNGSGTEKEDSPK